MCGGTNFKAVSLPLASFHQNIEPKEVDKNYLDLIIVGSGPAGLNSALQAKKRSLNYLLLEAGKLSQGIILNPASFFYPRFNEYSAPLKGDLWFQGAPKNLLLHKWKEQARNLLVSENEPVIDVRQNHDGYWVVSNQKKYLTKYIVLATGFRKFFFPVDFSRVFIVGRAGRARSITHCANQGFEAVEQIALRLGKQKIEEPKGASFEKERNVPVLPQTIFTQTKIQQPEKEC